MSAKPKKKHNDKRSDAQIARDNTARFQSAEKSGHKEFVTNAKLYNDFYSGEQWDPADKSRLDREGRPALTLNLILSTVSAIVGEQLDRKIDVTFTSSGGGSDDTAFALNALTKTILAANCYNDVEEDAFADGIITNRGFVDVRMDFSKNLRGDIKITCEDPIDVIIDPEAKSSDSTTWNEVFISRWLSTDQVAGLYGEDKAEKIRVLGGIDSPGNDDNFDYFEQTYGGEANVVESEEDARSIRRVRVIERQHYVPCKQKFLVDLRTGDMRPLPYDVNPDEAEAFAEQYGMGIHEQVSRRVRMTTSCSDVLLSDDWSIYRSFTLVPYFPYFRRGNPFGVVKNLIDPQRLLNKTSSQELHIVNTTANSGWVVEDNSLVDMDSDDLAARGAETGLVLTYRRGHNPPEKIQPNQIPTGIDRISQKASSTIREISAINAAMIGTDTSDRSGTARNASISQGQTQVSVVLSNLRRMRRSVAIKLLELIQDFYTETRYFDAIPEQMFGGPAAGDNPQQMVINGVDDDGNILNDVSIGNYDIIIGHAPVAGTVQQIQLEEATRLRELGVAIPDHVLVGYSGLNHKRELSEFLKQSQGFGDPTPEESQLQALKVQHEIQMLTKQLESIESEIELREAQAAAAQAKAQQTAGINGIEIQKLAVAQQAASEQTGLRIALAARSHENASLQNEKRLTAQIAMKAMDHSAAEKQKPNPLSTQRK